MLYFSVGFVVGVVIGWHISKPVWVDTLIKKVVEKVSGLFKKK